MREVMSFGAIIILVMVSFADGHQIANAEPQVILVPKEGPPVKKSKRGKCHEKGSKYYDLTTNFKPFNSIQECLDSGGQRPG